MIVSWDLGSSYRFPRMLLSCSNAELSEVPIKTSCDVLCLRSVLLILFIIPFGCALDRSPRGEAPLRNLEHQNASRMALPSGGLGEKTAATSQPTISNAIGRVVLDDAKYLLRAPLRIDATDALILGGVAAGIGGLMAVDGDIRKSFQNNQGKTKTDIAHGLETAGTSYVLLAGQLGLLASGYWFRENESGDKLYRTALISLEAQMFTEATTGFVKIAAGRSRPNRGRGSHSYTPFQDFSFDRSFVSGHAARAFTVAAVFADAYPQPVPFIAYSAASLIGLSRIYLDEHYSSDVFAGAALGFVIGKALSWRHMDKHKDVGLTFLPYVPNTQATLGLTIHYSFR